MLLPASAARNTCSPHIAGSRPKRLSSMCSSLFVSDSELRQTEAKIVTSPFTASVSSSKSPCVKPLGARLLHELCAEWQRRPSAEHAATIGVHTGATGAVAIDLRRCKRRAPGLRLGMGLSRMDSRGPAAIGRA